MQIYNCIKILTDIRLPCGNCENIFIVKNMSQNKNWNYNYSLECISDEMARAVKYNRFMREKWRKQAGALKSQLRREDFLGVQIILRDKVTRPELPACENNQSPALGSSSLFPTDL